MWCVQGETIRGATSNKLSQMGMGSVPLFSSVSLAVAGGRETTGMTDAFLLTQARANDPTLDLLKDVGGALRKHAHTPTHAHTHLHTHFMTLLIPCLHCVVMCSFVSVWTYGVMRCDVM